MIIILTPSARRPDSDMHVIATDEVNSRDVLGTAHFLRRSKFEKKRFLIASLGNYRDISM